MNSLPEWQRASSCAGGGNNCVELRRVGDAVAMRESDVPGAVLTAPASAARALLLTLKAGALGA
ncbi:DUF397 domain-containing protein [Streptomyces sp. NPDC053048]|uniref:DUF397 domain-containing protein n=1 Tax=Streptomyces sp. NPDC053048 TaxID=3365694 RepID=UPI0037D033AA